MFFVPDYPYDPFQLCDFMILIINANINIFHKFIVIIYFIAYVFLNKFHEQI